jgi:hypothetical protein
MSAFSSHAILVKPDGWYITQTDTSDSLSGDKGRCDPGIYETDHQGLESGKSAKR